MQRQKTYQFCNNCAKQGHLFNQCKMPITSIGIVAFRKMPSGARKYLMICRKDSLGYIEFLRGKYPLYNKEYIQALIDESQRNVTGEVKLLLRQGHIHLLGRKSNNSLYNEKLATFEEDNLYNQKDAEGFIKLKALRFRN